MKNQYRNLWSLLCCSLAALGLAGCSGSNVEQLASQGPDGPGALEIQLQNCGDRAHGDYWFERIPEIINLPLLCSNGSQGTADHFVEKELTCAQGDILETGDTRASLEFRNASCEPNSAPGACDPGTTRSCSVANGQGQQVCRIDGTGYEACVAQSCNTNFRLIDNSCQQTRFTGTGLFTCNAQNHCLLYCGEPGIGTFVAPGTRGFCSSEVPNTLSGNRVGSQVRSSWISANYNFPSNRISGNFVRANTTNVRAAILCDINWRTNVIFGRHAGCRYEVSGIEDSTPRSHPIWNGTAQQGVIQSGQVLNLDPQRFFPFSSLNKHTALTCFFDEFGNSSLCPTVWWRDGVRTNSSLGDSQVEFRIRANMRWTADYF